MMEIKKEQFNQRPSLVEFEGSVVRINFDVEESTTVVNNMSGGSEEEQEPEVIYLAHVIRVGHPLSVERIKNAVVEQGFDEYKAEEVALETLLWMTQNGQSVGNAVELAKQLTMARISSYDKSDAVNEFSYDGVPMWLDKETRNGLLMRFNAEKAAGKEETTLWYGTVSFSLTPDNGILMVNALELYASACYDKTSEHKATVAALDVIEDVLAYDYTAGYPDKLEF